ncbi:MAG: OmpA family protein [Geminicoccaceae bacterium]
MIDLKAPEAVGTYHSADDHKKRIDEMSLGLGNHRETWRGGSLAVALAFSVLAAVSMSPAVAHEHEEMCGPIVDGDGEAVLQSDGDILLHGGSFACPPEEVTAESVAVVPVRSVVLFDFDIDVPNGEGESALQGIIAELKDLSPDRINVSGHADRAGTEAYNQDLSQRRANNVVKRLIAGGIDAGSVTIEAFGETQPAVLTDDGVREPANRRVEIESAF